MSPYLDIFKQSLYMSFFTVLIPIGAYTIHSGSSAVVALVSYIFLSFWVPCAYVGMEGAAFGTSDQRISRTAYSVAWLVAMAVLAGLIKYGSLFWQGYGFWNWPTVGRDLVFMALMYINLCVNLSLAYLFSRLFGRRQGR